MARYKKRPGFDQPLPGLFDNLEGNSLFPEIEPLPIHPSISEAARLGFKRIVVSGYLGKGAKRPKGIEVVTINSVDQLPRALFVE